MVETAWSEPKMKVRNPASFVSMIRYELHSRCRLPLSILYQFQYELSFETLSVDGERLPYDFSANGTMTDPQQLSGSIAPPSVGHHDLVVSFRRKARGSLWVKQTFDRRGSVKASFDVIEKTPDELIQQYDGRDIHEEAMSHVSAGINWNLTRKSTLFICFGNSLPLAVAGRVYLRASGASEYYDVGPIVLETGATPDHCFQFGGFQNAPSVDIKIVPDAKTAIEESIGVTKILGSPMEWLDLSTTRRDGFPLLAP